MRVLVVEDEPMLADAIAEWLRDETHAVDVVNDGAAAMERIDVNDYDVVVLDRDLPLLHGDDVCRGLVGSGSTARVLMLTAAAEIRDRFTGAVRLTILKLRRKLGDPPVVETTPGVGYRIP
jgi:DNA-binding response OmpR family regulator